jgi:hypothetical protein
MMHAHDNTSSRRLPLLVVFVIGGLALGYFLLLSIGAIDYARDTFHYYWGCPSGKVMAEDYSCVTPTFDPENRPSGEKRE